MLVGSQTRTLRFARERSGGPSKQQANEEDRYRTDKNNRSLLPYRSLIISFNRSQIHMFMTHLKADYFESLLTETIASG